MGHELCLSVPGVHHRLQLLAGRAGLLHRTGQDGLGALAELRHHVTRGHLLALFLKFIYLYFFISYSFLYLILYSFFFLFAFYSSLLTQRLQRRLDAAQQLVQRTGGLRRASVHRCPLTRRQRLKSSQALPAWFLRRPRWPPEAIQSISISLSLSPSEWQGPTTALPWPPDLP